MRISDWSSDVCSSDLRIIPDLPTAPERTNQRDARAQAAGFQCELVAPGLQCGGLRDGDIEIVHGALAVARHRVVERFLRGVDGLRLVGGGVAIAIEDRQIVFDLRERMKGDGAVVGTGFVECGAGLARSEEHTSELPSLMRN